MDANTKKHSKEERVTPSKDRELELMRNSMSSRARAQWPTYFFVLLFTGCERVNIRGTSRGDDISS